MMIHAYSELYLTDAMRNLANCFDYAINTCGIDPDWFMKLFTISKISTLFEEGNPGIISGKSGVEVAIEILKGAYPNEEFPKPMYTQERSKEYWAGWALAQYQWYYSKRFKDIFSRVPLSEILSMYQVFHEMDIIQFYESMEKRYSKRVLDTNLKKIREARGLSQRELSEISGVSLRSIQLYEQRVNDIDKAQAQTLYKLAKKLGCSIEDILENPMSV